MLSTDFNDHIRATKYPFQVKSCSTSVASLSSVSPPSFLRSDFFSSLEDQLCFQERMSDWIMVEVGYKSLRTILNLKKQIQLSVTQRQ